MKKIITLIALVMLVSTSFVSAQQTLPISPGILPDSPFYGLKTALERIRMAFTFGYENKVNYGLYLAEKRLVEIEEIMKRPDLGEREINAIEKANLLRMNQMQGELERIRMLKLKMQEAPRAEEVRNFIESYVEAHEQRMEQMQFKEKI